MADGGDSKAADDWGLEVRGYACEVFDDPPTAWALHQERHLIPWHGEDRGLLVDRYDARNLLDDHTQFRQLKKRKRERGEGGDGSGGEQGGDDGEGGRSPRSEELYQLRYGDDSEEFEGEEQAATNAENRFPYAYPEDNEDEDKEEGGVRSVVDGDEEETDGEPFTAPFSVPSSVQVPKTLKRHNIIKATADKVRDNSQLEVMMKVRLGGNPQFAFLDSASAFHGYFCFLRDRKPQEAISRPKSVATARFSLLDEEYQDSDDGDDDS